MQLQAAHHGQPDDLPIFQSKIDMALEIDMRGCGSCIHCDQSGNGGLRRMCDVKKEFVGALDKPCHHYNDVWEQDLFGNMPNAEKLGQIKHYAK